jgi:hypothetical protein
VVIGVIGAALVEAAYRGVALAARRRRQPS